MTSSKAKGDALEKKAQAAIQEALGYELDFRALPVRVGNAKFTRVIQHDFFGAYDIMAKKHGEPTLWVQVSTLGQRYAKRSQVELVLPHFSHPHDRVLLFLWDDRIPPGHFQVDEADLDAEPGSRWNKPSEAASLTRKRGGTWKYHAYDGVKQGRLRL